MNLRYMMIKDKFTFSSAPKFTVFSPDEDKRRADEISLYIKELTLYGTSLNILTKFKPHSKLKDELLNIAAACASEDLFFNNIKNSRKLPINKLSVFTNKSKIFLEKWQYHILAYFLLLSNKNYIRLNNYLNVKNKKIENETTDVKALQPIHKSTTKSTGVVLQSSSNAIYVITSQGDFVRLNPDGNNKITPGEIYTGVIKKDLSHYRYAIIFTSICLIFSLIFMCYIYMRPSRTILIEANSSIRIRTNTFDRTVETKGLSVNGTKIIEPLKLFNKSIDDTIYLILKEAREKNLIKGKTEKDPTKITIFITSSKKDSPTLTKTSSYIAEHNLQVAINNNGIEHKIKKNTE